MTPALIHGLNHPIRRQILRILSEQGSERSPREITRLMTPALSSLSYHARSLCEQKIIRCARTRKVRGSTEHFYASDVSGNKLVDTILSETEKDDSHLFKRPDWG
jgi:DNA-binding transcriptional ArsR family regulator